MEPSCKTYVETDMVSLHYVTFIEPLAICLTEALSFDSDQFTKNSINKVIEEKTNDPFLLLQEHLSTAFFVYKKTYELQFDDLSYEVLEFFSEP
jgi:hypothetical protein